jgi:glycosyltransferase involved in cell wall biosynthesis
VKPIMDSILVSLISCNEMTSRGEAVVRRTLDSLSRAMAFLARRKPGVDVYVACCDDASRDGTADFIEQYFRGKDWFRLVRNRVNRFMGFSRNVASAQFATDLVCMLDADDEYLEDHLLVCSDAMEKDRDPAGKKFAAGYTRAAFSAPVHPRWAAMISGTIPISKVVRRPVWEFVEGMPMEEVYRKTTGDDQFLIRKIGQFFNPLAIDAVTVRYWGYPGSALDRQMDKFSRDPALYRADPAQYNGPALAPYYQLRMKHEAAFLEYLRHKWVLLNAAEQFQEYALR